MSPHSSSPLPYRLYRSLPAPVHRFGERVLRRRAERSFRRQPGFTPAQQRVLIGPLNTAGQGAQWARAVREHCPDVSALSVWAERGSPTPPLGYRPDVVLSRAVQLRGQQAMAELVDRATHVILESGFRLLGDVRFGDSGDDLDLLISRGITPALLFHGSDLRDLRRHAEMYDSSPFAGEWDDRLARMQDGVEQRRTLAAQAGVPVFVPTPDMLDFVPEATWLPLVVDPARYAATSPVLERERPVVLHAPTNPQLKGTAVIQQVLSEFDRDGLISYRELGGVPNDQMPGALADADIVVDQIVLGNVGVLATEAMASGRVVLSHVLDHVRERFARADPRGETVPVVDARPNTLAGVLSGILADREQFRALAGRGPAWVARNHDGRRSAAVLSDFLTGTATGD